MHFPRRVAPIKPTQTPSPVFTSKFCHFLLPRVYPVVDNEGLGNRWSTYETYFRLVQREWIDTDPNVRISLVNRLSGLIEATGASVFAGFPVANKIIELRLMGRHHPGMSKTSGPPD